MQKTALVLGGNGFVGYHLINRLKEEQFWIRCVDYQRNKFDPIPKVNNFIRGDIRDPRTLSNVWMAPNQKSEQDIENSFDEVYQLASTNNHAKNYEYPFHDANIALNDTNIAINIARQASRSPVKKIFCASSIYQNNTGIDLSESLNEYLYEKFASNYNLNISIGRYADIFGTHIENTRKIYSIFYDVYQAQDNSELVIENGSDILYLSPISKAIESTVNYLRSETKQPVISDINTNFQISLEEFVKLVIDISGKNIHVTNKLNDTNIRIIKSNQCSFNTEFTKEHLIEEIKKTYLWIGEI